MTRALVVPTGDPQVDEVGALGVNDDVARGYVAMNDAPPMQLARRGADVDRD